MECGSSETRLKESAKQGLPGRRKRKSDSGSPMKRRNAKRKLKEKSDISGSIKFYVPSDQDKISLFNKVDRCKSLIGDNISEVKNTQFLNTVLDFYLQSHGIQDDEANAGCSFERIQYTGYLHAEPGNLDEEHFLVSQSALRNMCAGILKHHLECKSLIDVNRIAQFGHVGKVEFRCEKNHTMKMDTSPHVEGGRFLANMQVMHGVYTSGLRYSQYERFCEGAKFGCCAESTFRNMHTMYCDVTEKVAEETITEAIQEEEMLTIEAAAEKGEIYKGMNILTDARHSTRKNARQSDIIVIGNRTHKVIGAVTVTKDDEPISQKHELIGVKKLYEGFDSSNVSIHIHGHDRNTSVNKYLREERSTVDNANDTWHAAKGVSRLIKPTGKGTRRLHGKTWHEELTDKAASVKTHVYYAMKNCDGSARKLREMLDNIVPHYQLNHGNCSPTSRCKTDENYIPSKVTIKDPAAASILQKAIQCLQIYKTPDDYIHCVDTHYVESFNNACLIFQDKRISFGNKEYKRRSAMAILDWNENVDRDYTSLTVWEDVRNPRRQTGSKNLKPKTCEYKTELWNQIMDMLYKKQ